MSRSRIIIREQTNHVISLSYSPSACSNFILHFIKNMDSFQDDKEQRSIMAMVSNIINKVDDDWLSSNYPNNLCVQIFHKVQPSVAFCFLYNIINNARKDAHNLILLIFDQLIRGNCFSRMLTYEMKNIDENVRLRQDSLITFLLSFPDVFANKIRPPQRSHALHHDRYYVMIGVQICRSLDEITEKDVGEINVSFLARVLSQISTRGKTDAVFQVIFPYLCCINNKKLQLIMHRVLESITTGMESILIYIFKTCTEPCILEKVLGKLVVVNKRVENVLLSRLLYNKHYNKLDILLNIFYYIHAVSPTSLSKVLKKSLQVWSMSAFIPTTPFEQHIYISGVILSCVRHLTCDVIDGSIRSQLMEMLMQGVRHHLDSPDANLRNVAMVTAERVTDLLQFSTDQKLRFDCIEDSNDVIKKLRDVFERPVRGEVDDSFIEKQSDIYKNFVRQFSSTSANSSSVDIVTSPLTYTVGARTANEIQANVMTSRGCDDDGGELDSDDDDDDDEFEAMHIPIEKPFNKHKPPMYIRDFMEGICEKDMEVEKFELYIYSLTDLIERSQHQIKEVSTQLCHMVLNLDNKFDVEDLQRIRKEALAGILVADPKRVCEFLANEFYSEHYTVSTRLEILDVIVIATGRLNTTPLPERKSPAVQEIAASEVKNGGQQDDLSWRQIVDDRIEKKTRRFSTKPKGRSVKIVAASKLTDIGGWLFYPFIEKYDRKIRTLDMMESDSMILSHLIRAVTVVCQASANCPMGTKMALDALGFIHSLLHHQEKVVIRSLIYSLPVIIRPLLPHIEDDDVILQRVLATRQWLCDVIEGRGDSQSAEGACVVLAMIQKQMSDVMDAK